MWTSGERTSQADGIASSPKVEPVCHVSETAERPAWWWGEQGKRTGK